MSISDPAVRIMANAQDHKGEFGNTDAPGSAAGSISVRGVSHAYVDVERRQRVHALENVDLDIAANEFVCIVGASGCGKTTLLNIVAGLVTPSEGTVTVDGVTVSGPGRDRGMVFQEYALLPWKTVLDNVALGPQLAGVHKAERRAAAREFLEMVGLKGFEAKYPHELSGGQRQRTAVARTLAADPKAMLMDEPFAAVDAQTRATLQTELVRIWQATGKTVIFVTHSAEEAVFLSTRIVVMKPNPGRVHMIMPVDIPRAERVAGAPTGLQATLASDVLAAIRNAGPGQASDAEDQA
jgi:NitT/TauT family transport system ATP-binding protein